MTAFVSKVTGRQYGKNLGCNIDIYIDTESLKNENSLKKDTQQQVPIQKVLMIQFSLAIAHRIEVILMAQILRLRVIKAI